MTIVAIYCEFCNENPAPYIYCQNDACQRASLGRLLRKAGSIEVVSSSRVVLQTQATCPLCRNKVAGQVNSSCAACQTTYHVDCLLELTKSRCSTIGCGKLVATDIHAGVMEQQTSRIQNPVP